MATPSARTSWLDTLSSFKDPRVMTMLAFGFSAGLPILLIFSSLSLWLREADVARSAVTYFSWAALGYSFKFVWAPLTDRLPIPFLTARLGRRRSWLLLSQISIVLAIVLMANTDPSQTLTMMAVAAVLLGFSSATQDIVIDAYRVEVASQDMQALLSSTYVAGYRIGMVIAGAGAISLASYFGSTSEVYVYSAWQMAYLAMAACMSIGILTTFVVKEPAISQTQLSLPTHMYVRFFLMFLVAVTAFVAVFNATSDIAKASKSTLKAVFDNRALASLLVESLRLCVAISVSGLVAWFMVASRLTPKDVVHDTYLAPVKDFFQRYGLQTAWLLLALVGLYRISDIVMGVIANVFYQDMGFTKLEIAGASKTFGLLMTIAGGFLGGVLSIRFGVYKILWLGAILSAATNLLFMLFTYVGNDLTMLYLVISADNISGGIASAAFIAFIASLTNISFTAMQMAIFSSLMTLLPKVLGGYSGAMVDNMGYSSFFILTALIGVPVLVLLHIAQRSLAQTPLKKD